MSDETPLPYPLPLLIAHAPKADRPWHALCWRIDDLMARTVLGAREGAVAAIRLAWWEEALTAPGPRQGEPLLAQWQAFNPGDDVRAAINAIAGAWRMLLDPAPMSTAEWLEFGKGRGALFPLIARRPGDTPLENAGASWALWDVANRDADRERARGAFAAAREAAGATAPRPASLRSKPLALAAAMADDDIKADRLPEGRFTPGQYLRLLRRAPFF
jgi:hypothetical protein